MSARRGGICEHRPRAELINVETERVRFEECTSLLWRNTERVMPGWWG